MIVEVRISARGNVSIYEVVGGVASDKKLAGIPLTRPIIARMGGRSMRRFHAEHATFGSMDPSIETRPHAIELVEPVD